MRRIVVWSHLGQARIVPQLLTLADDSQVEVLDDIWAEGLNNPVILASVDYRVVVLNSAVGYGLELDAIQIPNMNTNARPSCSPASGRDRLAAPSMPVHPVPS